MKITRFSLVCAAAFGSCLGGQAQPNLPPAVQRGVAEPAPLIDEKAEQFVEAMMVRYAGLKSYIDLTQLRLENAAGEPVKGGGRLDDLKFQATLQWERPANVRFEGFDNKGAFLALGTPNFTRIVSARYPGNYVSRQRSQPTTYTAENGTLKEFQQQVSLSEPLMGNPIPGAPGLGFMLDADSWQRTKKDVRALSFEPDARIQGEACRVVRLQILDNSGIPSVMLLFVAKSDGLLRRVENRDDRMPADTFIVETHSDVESNIDLPAARWNFVPPAAAKPVDYFANLKENQRDLTPDIKVGDSLPTFSADALDGAPLELNPQSGVATVVYFFTMNSGVYDVQILNQLARAVAPDKMQIVGVSGDGLRPRIEEFAARYKVNFPIYFDETGRNNALAEKFGVTSWASTFVFGTDGKLQFIGSRPGRVENIAAIRKLLPEIDADTFVLKNGEYLDAE